MIELDEVEQLALKEFLKIIADPRFQPKTAVLEKRIHRAMDGEIIVPVSVKGKGPSFTAALFTNHKAEQLSKQSNCRFVLAQCPNKDPKSGCYVWGDGEWQQLS